MADRWRLDAREVTAGYTLVAPPHTTLAKLPEGADLREYVVWLEHDVTGMRVEGKAPAGTFTQRDLKLIEIELRKSLFAELELKVARYLRIDGV